MSDQCRYGRDVINGDGAADLSNIWGEDITPEANQAYLLAEYCLVNDSCRFKLEATIEETGGVPNLDYATFSFGLYDQTRPDLYAAKLEVGAAGKTARFWNTSVSCYTYTI